MAGDAPGGGPSGHAQPQADHAHVRAPHPPRHLRLGAHIKPLLSRLATGEFDSPQLLMLVHRTHRDIFGSV
eukprot:154077-Prorocentrum_minimum.AAC.2